MCNSASVSAFLATSSTCCIVAADMPDRQAWVERIAMCHWSQQEIMSGQAWQHIKKFIN